MEIDTCDNCKDKRWPNTRSSILFGRKDGIYLCPECGREWAQSTTALPNIASTGLAASGSQSEDNSKAASR